MPEALADTDLRWEMGVPVSSRFDDPYYARSDGLAESRHVFLDGNNLAERFAGAKTFHTAELGFGTGLNFLATWALWREVALEGAILTHTSFERYPMAPEAQLRALAVWPELADLAQAMVDGDMPDVRLSVIQGDARDRVPAWNGRADAWFLDGFAPARNPEMWEPGLMQAVHDHTTAGGTFGTYTAAGHVRRSLEGAGFMVIKRAGFGTKREMLTGRRP